MTQVLKSWRTVRLSLVREPGPRPSAVRGPAAAADLARAVIGDDPREHVVAIYLDASARPIAVHRVHIGTAEESPVHPREVFGPALQLSASMVVLAHNHPSGDHTPSDADRRVTNRLREAGQILGVPLIDHLVVGPDGFSSAAPEAGL